MGKLSFIFNCNIPSSENPHKIDCSAYNISIFFRQCNSWRVQCMLLCSRVLLYKLEEECYQNILLLYFHFMNVN